MSDPKDDKKKVDASLPEDGAPAEGAEGGAPAEGKKLNIKKIILFGVVPLFVLLGAGGGLYFSGMLDKFIGKGETGEHGEAGEPAEAEGGHGGGHGEKGEDHAGAIFLEIPDMIVNLSSSDGQPRYLRLSIQLELKSEADKAAVEGVMPRVIDQFQTYLRELRVKDLRGSAGMYRLQMELLARVNAAAAPVEVKDVLFQEILIQ